MNTAPAREAWSDPRDLRAQADALYRDGANRTKQAREIERAANMAEAATAYASLQMLDALRGILRAFAAPGVRSAFSIDPGLLLTDEQRAVLALGAEAVKAATTMPAPEVPSDG